MEEVEKERDNRFFVCNEIHCRHSMALFDYMHDENFLAIKEGVSHYLLLTL
jgi:hypothetical protein